MILWDIYLVIDVFNDVIFILILVLGLSFILVFRYVFYGEVFLKLDVYVFGVVLFEIIFGRVVILFVFLLEND